MYKLYKMYINVNQIIYTPADVCLMYATPPMFLLFKFLHEQQHHLPFYFGYFVKFPILKKIHRWIYIIDLFSINLTYFNFNIFSIFYLSFSIFFSKFFDILFIKIQVIFINFLIPYFLAKKSGEIYFLEPLSQGNR